MNTNMIMHKHILYTYIIYIYMYICQKHTCAYTFMCAMFAGGRARGNHACGVEWERGGARLLRAVGHGQRRRHYSGTGVQGYLAHKNPTLQGFLAHKKPVTGVSRS